MDFIANFTSAESKIFLDIINIIRRQNDLPNLVFSQFDVPDNSGVFVGQRNYINELDFFFTNTFLYSHFQTLQVKNSAELTTFDNQLFGRVINAYRISINLIPYVFTIPDVITQFFQFVAVERLSNPPTPISYPVDTVNLWFTILNQERLRKGFDPILIPNNVIDPLTWFFDIKINELPEFNTKTDALLVKDVKVWVINHLIQLPDGPSRDVICLAVFTNKDMAVEAYAILVDTSPDQIFFISELLLNIPSQLYLPIPEKDYPVWLKTLIAEQNAV